MHTHTTIASGDCSSDEMSPTWTVLIWAAQGAFDLFVWVLLVALVVTGRYHGRHDRVTGDRSPSTGQHADLPPQTTPVTTSQGSDLH
jgi:hypothetical protein